MQIIYCKNKYEYDILVPLYANNILKYKFIILLDILVNTNTNMNMIFEASCMQMIYWQIPMAGPDGALRR